MRESRKRLKRAIGLLAALFAVGVAGYVAIEGWSAFDAVYMTAITLTTVGYGLPHPLSKAGTLFTIFLALFGMGGFLYAISTITACFIETDVSGFLRRKKMKSGIDRLSGHYIVCGAGDMGRHIIEELRKTGRSFVVVEKDPEGLRRLAEDEGILFVEGDPADDAVLLASGIARASALLTALPSDRDNLYVVISARSLNPALRIVSRAVEESCAPKLKKAGADVVVSANAIGGLRMASELIRPAVVNFLETMLRGPGAPLRVEELEVGERSSLAHKTLKDAAIRERLGLAVIGVKNAATGVYEHIPRSSRVIAPRDILIVIGTPEQIAAARRA